MTDDELREKVAALLAPESMFLPLEHMRLEAADRIIALVKREAVSEMERLVEDNNARAVLIVELLAMPKANIGFAGNIHIRRARRIIDGDNDAKAQGEENYRAFCAALAHEHDGTIDGLKLIVRMIEQYAADALPANDQGQVHFARAMLESAAGEVAAYLAALGEKP